MKKLILSILFATCALTFGCVDYLETMALDGDCGGTVSMRISIDEEARKQAEEMMNSMAAAFGGSPEDMESQNPFDVDEKTIKARLKERNSSAKLTKHKKSKSGGDEVTEISFSFKDQDDWSDIAYALDKDDAGDGEVPFIWASVGGGVWEFTRSLDNESSGHSMTGAGAPPADGKATGMPGMPPGGGAPDLSKMFGGKDPSTMTAEELQASAANMMKNMESAFGDMEKMQADAENAKAQMEDSMEGRSIRFEVTFPGKILESNATSTKGNTAIWEYALSAMQEGATPDAFTAKVKR